MANDETEYFRLYDEYYAKFDDVFPIMEFMSITLAEAAAMMKDAIEKGKPVDVPSKDKPDVLY